MTRTSNFSKAAAVIYKEKERNREDSYFSTTSCLFIQCLRFHIQNASVFVHAGPWQLFFFFWMKASDGSVIQCHVMQYVGRKISLNPSIWFCCLLNALPTWLSHVPFGSAAFFDVAFVPGIDVDDGTVLDVPLVVVVLDDALLVAVRCDSLLVGVLDTEISREIALDVDAGEGKEVPPDCRTVDEAGLVTFSTPQLPFTKHVYTVSPLPPSGARVAWSPADTVLLPQVLFRLALAWGEGRSRMSHQLNSKHGSGTFGSPVHVPFLADEHVIDRLCPSALLFPLKAALPKQFTDVFHKVAAAWVQLNSAPGKKLHNL